MTNKSGPSDEVVAEAVERLKRHLEGPEFEEAFLKELPKETRKYIALVDEKVIKIKETLHGYRLTLERSPLRPYVHKIGDAWTCNCGFKNCTHISTVLSHINSQEDDSLEF